MKIVSLNPYTEEKNGEFELLEVKRIEEEIARSRQAFLAWKSLPIRERQARFKKLAAVLDQKKRQCAEVITKEMGKPIKQSLTEIERCMSICDYFSEHSEEMLEKEIVKTPFKRSYVSFEPMGVILAVMPWNFPFIQVLRFAVPALVAGNVVVLKHASNVPMCGQEIEKLFAAADFPQNVFKTLRIDASAAMQLIKSDQVDGVSLTGSYRAGCQLGSLAGAGIKRIVLELGGSDPFLVLKDVNIKAVAQVAVQARFVNGGQSCVAAKRFIVEQSIADEFTEEFHKHFQALKIGDPMDERTDLGPMAMKDSLPDLQRLLDDAARKRAKIIMGPETPKKGFFFRPALIPNADPSMAIAREEVFGPIAPIFIARDEEEMIAMANDTEYGLGATIWSKDIERAERIVPKLEAGYVAINKPVKSDPRLPFGGTKKSGLGRELSPYGMKEFTNIKTVVIEDGAA